MGEHSNTTLYQQLHKLSSLISQEQVDAIVTTLWRSRRTGLASADKARIQSLLSLPSPSEVDPVSACLRTLMRKCASEDLSESDLLKLFPPDLEVDLRGILVMLLLKNKSQWREEISSEQHWLPHPGISSQVKTGMPPSIAFPSSDTSVSSQPHQDDLGFNFNCRGTAIGSGVTVTADASASHSAPISLHRNGGAPEEMGNIPHFLAMSWTIENQKSPGHKLAVITLKLQDRSKSPSGQKELRFQLTKDTLEAMLKSMAFIKEQLFSMKKKKAQVFQSAQQCFTCFQLLLKSKQLGATLMNFIFSCLRSFGLLHQDYKRPESSSEPLRKKQKQ